MKKLIRNIKLKFNKKKINLFVFKVKIDEIKLINMKTDHKSLKWRENVFLS